MTNQTVAGSRLTGYIVNVIRSPVIERLMVRGSQVALKHVIHDIHVEARTLVMELRQLKDGFSVVTDRRLKISPEECLYDSGLIGLQYRAS